MLTRVAHAVDEAKQDEKARDQAKHDLTDAQHHLSATETRLAAAETALALTRAAASTIDGLGSAFGAPAHGIAKVEAEEQAALQQIRREVTAAQHAVDHARRVYQAAERRFEQADGRRKAMLRHFAGLCEEEARIATLAIPQVPVVNLIDVTRADELRSEAAALLGLPLLAVSGFAVVHLRQVESALRHHDSARLDRWASSAYRRLFPPPPKPKPQHHSSSPLGWLESKVLSPAQHYVLSPIEHVGKEALRDVTGFAKHSGWAGAVGVGVVSAGLIALSGGTDAPIVLGADASTLSTTAGVSGLVSEGATVGDDVIHRQPIDPEGLTIAGATGLVSGAIPGVASGALLGDAAKLRAILPVRAAAGAVTNAGLNAGSQAVLYDRVHWGTVAVAAGGGLWAGGWPGAGDPWLGSTISNGRPAQIALSLHQSQLPAYVSASTDGAGPAPHTHPRSSSR
ncbi:MAG: hypothetical protein J2O39_05360, partial [Acidimicrobiales bacterium]|nr:hypothetical protein [Acidimicrobiales bacterium]